MLSVWGLPKGNCASLFKLALHSGLCFQNCGWWQGSAFGTICAVCAVAREGAKPATFERSTTNPVVDADVRVQGGVPFQHTALFIDGAFVHVNAASHGAEKTHGQYEWALLKNWEKDPVAILARAFTQGVNTKNQNDNLDNMLRT